jgi:hypothetical protein
MVSPDFKIRAHLYDIENNMITSIGIDLRPIEQVLVPLNSKILLSCSCIYTICHLALIQLSKAVKCV